MTAEDKLRRFVAAELHCGDDELSDDFPLIERQVIDSMGIFEIVGFVEREFGVEVLDEELVPEHFGTIGGIAHLVRSKLASSAPAQRRGEIA